MNPEKEIIMNFEQITGEESIAESFSKINHNIILILEKIDSQKPELDIKEEKYDDEDKTIKVKSEEQIYQYSTSIPGLKLGKTIIQKFEYIRKDD